MLRIYLFGSILVVDVVTGGKSSNDNSSKASTLYFAFSSRYQFVKFKVSVTPKITDNFIWHLFYFKQSK